MDESDQQHEEPRGRLRDLPGFRPLIATYAINDVGDLLAMVALAVFIYDGTNSVWALAAMFTASRLVPSVVAPWMTARLAPLKVAVTLPGLYAVEAVLFGVLAFLVSQDAPLGWLLLLAGLDGLLALTGRSLTRGVMATIFDGGGMLRAGNAFVSQLNAWLLVLATAGAYAFIELVSPEAALWINVGTFVGAALIMSVTGRSLPAAEVEEDDDEESGPAKGRTREGLRHVWQRPRARRLVIGEGLAMMFGSLVIPVEVVYAKDALGAGSSAYGLLFAAWGVGSIIGATVFKRYHERNLGVIVAGAAVVCGLGYVGLAVSPTLAIALAFSVLGGAGNGAEWVAVMTALQEDVDKEFYARASGLLESIAVGGPAIAYAGGAALTAAAGPRWAYAIGGVVSVLVGAYWFAKPVAGLVGEHDPEAREASASAEQAYESVDLGSEQPVGRKAVIGTLWWSIAAIGVIALVGIVGVQEHWQPEIFAGLLVLAVAVAPLAIEGDDYNTNGILATAVIAAVVLGPAEAAVVALGGGFADIAWFMYREQTRMRANALLASVLSYSVYPLGAGLVAAVLVDQGQGLNTFLGAVALVYAFALATNMFVVGIYAASEYGTPMRESMKIGPILWAEVLAAMLCAGGIHVLWARGSVGLVLVAATLVVFLRLAKRFFESLENARVAVEQRGIAEQRRAVAEQQKELVAYSQRFTIVKIMHALAAKDPSTARHSAAVSGYMRAFAEYLSLDEPDVQFCGVAGLLHDNGKMSVPEAILTKPGKLEDDEYATIKKHAQDGADFVRDLDGFGDISDVIVAHHERWDGGGYPNGLKGEEIPTIAMMINICDAYDVLTSRSLYSEPKPHPVVIDILLGDRGTILTAWLVDEFVGMMESRDDLRYDPDQGDKFEQELALFLGPRPADPEEFDDPSAAA